ncbi:MAG TPA: hypothetical protein VF715_02350 [Thermoleophilaceae bacterium]
MAGAASFGGGNVKLSVKISGVKAKASGAALRFSEDAGEATLNKQASGSLNFGAGTSKLTLTRGKKSIVLQSFVEKLTTGKGQITAKINGKGKAIAFFDQASANKLQTGNFEALTLPTVNITLTKAGAAALNKAFGLKAPAKGKKDLRLKAKAKAGTSSFVAERSLTVTGGVSRTVYDPKFVQDLRACDITLGSVAPATPIAQDPGAAPEGGVNLPITGGALKATTLIGSVLHSGGTVLQRPEGSSSGKSAYNSPLTNFEFGFSGGRQSLKALIVNLNNAVDIGDVTGTPSANLTDGPGKVTLQGELVLSAQASGTLSSKSPPPGQGPQVGADCPIPAGSKIGAVLLDADVG